MKIIFFGTSSVGLPVLEALHKNHIVSAVVTNPDAPAGRKQILTASPVAEYAQKFNIPILKPASFKDEKDIRTFSHMYRKCESEIFVVVSYGKILPKEIIELPRLKTLNVHFSLLPRYRGAAPVQHALWNGESKTGVTIFVLDELMDHGPIVMQEKIDIAPDDTTPRLLEKMAKISVRLLLEVLPKYAEGEVKPTEQDHSSATRASIIKKEDGRVDWTQNAQKIYNQWRALLPWPGIFTTWNGKLLKIVECLPSEAPPLTPPLQGGEQSLVPLLSKEGLGEVKPGTVLSLGLIACGRQIPSEVEGQNTYLQIQKLQLEGKTVVDIKEFINGYPKFIGTNLGKEE